MKETHPNIPKPIPLLQPPVRIPRSPFPLNLPCPFTPANRLQFLHSKDEAERYHHERDEGFHDDVLRDGGGG